MKYPLAIIDYGIGGLGLYKMVRAAFPDLPILYFSDSGVVPYGKQPKRQLRNRIEQVTSYLLERGVERIIVACHAASSVVRESDAAVTGLRRQTIRAVLATGSKKVGVIGGGRTIRSGYYRRELTKAGIQCSQRIAQPLSILVERGEIDSAEVHRQVSRIVRPLRTCDSILLACTHYPVLTEVIQQHAAPGTRLIDPVAALFRSIRADVGKMRMHRGESLFLTTGDPKLMTLAARKAFGVTIRKVQQVRRTLGKASR